MSRDVLPGTVTFCDVLKASEMALSNVRAIFDVLNPYLAPPFLYQLYTVPLLHIFPLVNRRENRAKSHKPFTVNAFVHFQNVTKHHRNVTDRMESGYEGY